MNYRARRRCLCLSQVAGITADFCLLQAVIGFLARERGWHVAAIVLVLLYLLPIIFFVFGASFGPIAYHVRPRAVLSAGRFCRLSSAIVLTASAITGWSWSLAVIALGAAVLIPVRSTLLPVARQRRTPLGRQGIVLALAVLAGAALGAILLYEWPGRDLLRASIIGLYLLSLLAALPAVPAPWRQLKVMPRILREVRDDARWVVLDNLTRGPLLALVCCSVLGPVLLHAIHGHVALTHSSQDALMVLTWLLGGTILGCLITLICRHPRRLLGWVPYGCLLLFVAILWLLLIDQPWIPGPLIGIAGGFILTPLYSTYQTYLPPTARRHGLAVLHGAVYLAAATVVALVMPVTYTEHFLAHHVLWTLFFLTAVGTCIALRSLLRESLELPASLVVLPLYRIRGCGPGAGNVPVRGPLIIVANHSAWFDPLWLAKVIPRPLIALMGSGFYDVPVLRFVMRHIVRAVRIEESKYRHEVPELDEAVRRLDRGECLMLFPEGHLRLEEDVLLRPFRQGIWRILQLRPDTPVVPCWIEGGWGSFVSRRYGPPGRGKPFDRLRPITVVIGKPERLSPEILAEHRTTRRYLMDRVLALRQYLPGGATPAAPTAGDEDAVEDELAKE